MVSSGSSGPLPPSLIHFPSTRPSHYALTFGAPKPERRIDSTTMSTAASVFVDPALYPSSNASNEGRYQYRRGAATHHHQVRQHRRQQRRAPTCPKALGTFLAVPLVRDARPQAAATPTTPVASPSGKSNEAGQGHPIAPRGPPPSAPWTAAAALRSARALLSGTGRGRHYPRSHDPSRSCQVSAAAWVNPQPGCHWAGGTASPPPPRCRDRAPGRAR
jgi:hypothetical protein